MKKLITLILAAVMALSLAAVPAAAAQQTISLTLWGAEEDQALLARLVEKFQAQYPDQTFDIQGHRPDGH